MSDITLSKAVRSNLLNLQSTATMLGKSQERLSTGLRVNSALDNPTNFFTAQSLNSRASDLSQLLDAVSNAVQTVAAADKGITAITKLVESAQATARQALQSSATIGGGTVTAATKATMTAGAFTTLNVGGTGSVATSAVVTGSGFSTDGIDLSAEDASISFDLTIGSNKVTITLDKSMTAGDLSAVTAVEISEAINAQFGGSEDVSSVNSSGQLVFTDSSTGTGSTVIIGAFSTEDGADATGLGFTAGTKHGDAAVAADSVTFSIALDGGSSTAITLNATKVGEYNTAKSTSLSASSLTVADVAAIINHQIGGGSTAAGVSGGKLTFTSTTEGGSSKVQITGYTALATSGSTGIANGSKDGAAASGGDSVPNPKRAELVDTYNELLGQIDALAKDSGFNGVNLLNGDNLSVLFSEDGSSKLNINGITDNAHGLGLTVIDRDAFNDNGSINATLDNLKGAIETLRTQSAKFGSNLSVVETRQDFTKNMINVLQTGASNLTLADTNEEAANVLALQTRQQLSSTALSLASQADQNVLRLF